MTLKLNGTNSEAAPAYAGDDADTGLQCGTNELKLVTGGTARATADSAGRLLVGTSTNTAPGSFDAKLQIADTSYTGSISMRRDANNAGSQSLVFGKSRGSLNGNTIVQDGDALGGIAFYGADGNDLNSAAAQIYAYVDGTPGSNDMPGRLIFSTTADGASSPTERLRITSDGTIRLASGCPGIDFSQIQTNRSGVSSETLDSYEEGTWDPVIAFGGSATGITYQEQKGLYVKIGSLVWASIVVSLSNNGSGTGAISITLPFTVGSNSENRGIGTVAYFGGFSNINSNPNVYASGAGQTTCRLQHINSATGAGTQVSTLTDSHVGSSSTMRAAIMYTTM